MTLQVEMDRLAGLGSTLQELAVEAAILRTGPSAGPWFTGPGSVQPAVVEAADIAHDVVDALLVSAVSERLSETGEIMVNVAEQFRNADDGPSTPTELAEALEVAMSTYTDATGEWDVPEAPR